MNPRAYYNDNDPRLGDWLRELIRRRAIADGEVDTRSIVSVSPADLAGFTQCHFFAGIGGWSYALKIARWPDDREVWTGSCPCQPWSAANVWRTGPGHDDPRHLWPAWFRLITGRRPIVVFGEQVSGAAGLAWIDGVGTDLDRAGYTLRAYDLDATVFRPHRRRRLFFVADSPRAGLEGLAGNGDNGEESGRFTAGPFGSLRNADLWGDVSRVQCRDGRDRPVPVAHGVPADLDGGGTNDEPTFTVEQRRTMILRGYGNAIVPDVAAAMIAAYLDDEP